jgi:hypothetical protein
MNMDGDARRKPDISDEAKGHSFPVKITPKKSVNPRNICTGLFVYTSAAGFWAVAGWTEISESKNPAVAAAGS